MEYCFLDKCYRRDWIVGSSLCQVGIAFEDYLRKHQYRKNTIHVYFAAVAHFAYWSKANHIEISDIDEVVCDRFARIHLPSCSCPSPRQRQGHTICAALSHLLIVLREQGFIADQPDTSALSIELVEFHSYLT